MNAPFSMIRQLTARRCVELQLIGDVDADTVRQLSEKLGPCEQADNLPLACIDLRQMTSCSLEARRHLVHLHQTLVKQTERRAYIASSPVIRGVATWVLHVCPDRNGKVVLNDTAALKWLEISTDRLSQAEAGLDAYLASANHV